MFLPNYIYSRKRLLSLLQRSSLCCYCCDSRYIQLCFVISFVHSLMISILLTYPPLTLYPYCQNESDML